MPIKYIGRRTDFKGKTLWEILSNLKNFGVGRIILRNMMQRYPEPTYFKVLKVAAMPNEDPRKVTILAERVFRGRPDKKYVQIDSTTYKADYLLVPKDQEYKYKPLPPQKESLMPTTMDFPPLMKEILMRKFKSQGIKQDLKLPLYYNLDGNKLYRVAKEGEKPDKEFTLGVGTPATPSLYSDIKPI